ncbi:C69 family dipeptidase [Mesorhizobium sp. M0622]
MAGFQELAGDGDSYALAASDMRQSVQRRIPYPQLPGSTEPGLLGMDLLRLTLERAATADEGLDILIALLERYGQSGRASATRDMTYHNSFIIADGRGGWIVQTAGRHWVAKRIQGWASISNVYSIGSDYDRISAHAADFATQSGWHDPAADAPFDFATQSGWHDPAADAPFDFAAAYADPEFPALPGCVARFALSQAQLTSLEERGKISLEEVFAVLRSHGAGDADAGWRLGADGESVLCMHARSPEGFETAASMVAELPRPEKPDEPLLFWASLASPCMSTFVPVWPGAETPRAWMQPEDGAFDAWWEQESMQRLIERDYGRYAKAPRALFAELEADTLAAVRALSADAAKAVRAELTSDIIVRQQEARGIISRMTEACACKVLSRQPDLRGSYLQQVDATRPQTFRAVAA